MSESAELSQKEQMLSPEALAFVRSVGTATDLPAFVRNVRAISSVASDLDARVALLEQAITKDVALTGKVLRIASSAMTGSSQPISSVKQAIMMLGYDRVQHLSTSTSVFDQIEKSAPAVEDLLVLSVLTANQSLCLAIEVGYGRPEVAYLCGLFRNLGEVLVACYRATRYREWVAIANSGRAMPPGSEARHFGFSFDDVGMVLARQWGMPPDVVNTLCRVPMTKDAPRDRLHHITQFSADLTRLQYGATAEQRDDDEVRALITSYTKVLGVDAKAVDEATEAARMESKPTLDSMQLSVNGWMASREQRAIPELSEAVVAAQSLAELITAAEPRASDTTQEAHVRSALRALTTQRIAGEEVTVGGATGAMLDASRGAGFRRSLLALSTADFKMVKGRMGAGPGHEDLVRTFAIRPLTTFGPLGTALLHRTDLFVDLQSKEGKVFARDRLVKAFGARTFALLPLVLEDRLIGCLYFDSEPEAVEVTETLCWLLRTMRDHLAAAFAKHRQNAVADAA